MRLKLFFTFLFNIAVLSAQKEVFFNDVKDQDLKVKSLHGLELDLIPFVNIYNPHSFFLQKEEQMNLSARVGYFIEKRICSNWTVISTIGINNKFFRRPIWTMESNGSYLSSSYSKTSTAYVLELDFGVEPRWYYDHKGQCQDGNTLLNSGWFLSLPIASKTVLLKTPEPFFTDRWTPYLYTGSLSVMPSLGYRQSITNHCFIETSFGAGSKYKMPHGYFDDYGLDFEFKLKAGYSL